MMKWTTVKNAAINLRLVFPRQGPTHLVSGPLASDKPAKPKPKTRSETRTLNRKRWLAARRKDPSATKSKLYRDVGSSHCDWLYKNDKEWLLAHSPPPFKRIGSARTVDWQERDARLVSKINTAAVRIKNAPGQPIRITKQSIARELDELTAIFSKKANSKLPLTRKAIERVVETPVDFAIRKIHWAADKLRQEGAAGLSMLRQHAHVNHALWYLPEVEAAFDSALQSLESTRTENQVSRAA